MGSCSTTGGGGKGGGDCSAATMARFDFCLLCIFYGCMVWISPLLFGTALANKCWDRPDLLCMTRQYYYPEQAQVPFFCIASRTTNTATRKEISTVRIHTAPTVVGRACGSGPCLFMAGTTGGGSAATMARSMHKSRCFGFSLHFFRSALAGCGGPDLLCSEEKMGISLRLRRPMVFLMEKREFSFHRHGETNQVELLL
jgi:hypothetical protein